MNDNNETIEELDMESDHEDDQSCELVQQDDEDLETAYDDHLTEAIQARIKTYVPRHVQHAGEATEDYCEVLTERALLIDGSIVDQVGANLIEPALAPMANVLQGVIESDFIGNDQLFELSYRHISENDASVFIYILSVDGKFIRSFRSAALANLAYQVCLDHKVENLSRIINRVCFIFEQLAVRRGEDKQDTCSYDFVTQVSHLVMERFT